MWSVILTLAMFGLIAAVILGILLVLIIMFRTKDEGSDRHE